jgi:hypothetical protein
MTVLIHDHSGFPTNSTDWPGSCHPPDGKDPKTKATSSRSGNMEWRTRKLQFAASGARPRRDERVGVP